MTLIVEYHTAICYSLNMPLMPNN